MCLNHPQTIPPPRVCGKIVFHETDPWCQKGWGLLIYSTLEVWASYSDAAVGAWLDLSRELGKQVKSGDYKTKFS